MFPQSIRWRLSINYAAIALITALVLGVVLLAILNEYYDLQEKSYLKTTAEDMEPYLADLAQDTPAEILKGLLDPNALVTQIRFRLMNANRETIYDSGPPSELKYLDVLLQQDSSDTTITEGIAVEGGQLVSVSTNLVNELYISVIDIPDTEGGAQLHYTGYTASLDKVDMSEGGSIVMDNLQESASFAIAFPTDINTAGVGPDEVDNFFHRSQQSLEVPIYDSDQKLVGYLELSDGPAFGYRIVQRIAKGWAVASVVAVIFAALIGWGFSRRMSAPILNLNRVTEQMAHGDLTVRADTTPQGEIGELAASFNSMAVQVEATVSTLRQFVSDAAHELHTPLTSLRTNLELIIDAPDDAGRQKEFAVRAKAQAERLQKLTNDLLELSRVEAQVHKQPGHSANLTRLLREYRELYASWADQSDLSLITDIPDEIMTVPLNEKQLGHIVHNLFENAIKFTPKGGTITLGLCSTDDALPIKMWIEDTGIGIPVEDLPRLFERFHRGQNAVDYPGHGLGLAIVRLVVESCGGTVKAQNTSSGTRFTVLLPCAK